MKYFKYLSLFIVAVVVIIGCDKMALPSDVEAAMANVPDKVDYNIDIKPILSDKCFACHGPDAKKQQGELRLDIADFAYSKIAESGYKAINPGSLSKSEMIRRILSADADYKMPTPESHLSLTAQEKATLVKWVKQGAGYKPHWALVAPVKVAPPGVKGDGWVKNDIDKFVLTRLEKKDYSHRPKPINTP